MALVVESCRPELQQWLASTSPCRQSPASPDSSTVRGKLSEYVEEQLYWYAHTDYADSSTGGPAGSTGPAVPVGWCGIAYWLQQLNSRLCHLKSTILLTMLKCIESAPLVCILSDCLHHVDEFFLECEQQSATGQSDNKLFLQGLEMYCLLKYRLQTMIYQWSALLSTATPVMFRGFVEANRYHLIASMESMVKACHQAMHSTYPATDRPRYLQLSDKLQLSLKEQEAMHFIFIQNAGVIFTKLHKIYGIRDRDTPVAGSHVTSMALAAASFAEMNGREMYEFYSEDRLHLQQELISPEDEFSSLSTASFLKMPSVVLKACCGCQLSSEELYKVDKTALGEILLAENSVTAGPTITDDSDTVDVVSQQLLNENDDVENEQGEHEEDEAEEDHKGETEEDHKGETEEGAAVPLGCVNRADTQVYSTDLEYLEDNFELIEVLVKARKTESSSDDMLLLRADQRRPEAVLRELKAKARSITAKVAQRMEATRRVDKWLPRLERLADLKKLDVFEKNVLLTLTGCMVSRNLRDTDRGDSIFKHQVNIGRLIALFCEGLEEQIGARVYFYRNSQLVKEGLIHVSDPPLLSRGNFLDSIVELDRRLLDYIVGLDTELNELVDGSDLYTPETMLSDVALPPSQRQLLLNTFDSFYKFQKTCKDLKLNTQGYSKGLCLLFYGPSGTGKTMTANAVANFLGKKVLLLTVSLLAERELTKDLLQFLFREAKIHNALIFFDECEALFESRENRSNTSLALMLTEIEHNDGIIILATNRHQDLDEAMHRRIQLSLPFTIPDHTLRAKIWQSHVPDQLIKGEVDWMCLAESYELTGGLIRNAVLSAVSLSSMKSMADEVLLTSSDLHAGAKLQLRGLLEMMDFERRVIPTFGLDNVVVDRETENQLQVILHTAKSHKFISSQWGFTTASGNVASAAGVVVVVSAPARAGKTTLGHALAYELGQPVKEASCSELLSHTVNSNPRASRGIAAFFKDASTANAVVILDNSELILGSASMGMLGGGVVGCETYSLAYQVERYPGLVILNTRLNTSLLDLSRLPQLRYVVCLKLPSVALREKLWRKLLPERVPVSSDLDFAELANRYPLYGGQIATAICSAAEHIASSPSHIHVVLTTQLLSTSAEEQVNLANMNKTQIQNMFQ